MRLPIPSPASARRAVPQLVWAFALALLLSLDARRTHGFSLFVDQNGSVVERMEHAARWSAEPDPFGRGTGLHDGIQVAIESSFATDLGAAQVAALYGISEATAVALVEQSVRQAFLAWENAALRFDLHFGGPAVEGPGQGMEIDVFARPSDEVFFGFTNAEILPAEDRRLTNGQRFPGDVIVGADIFLNTTRLDSGVTLLAGLGLPLDSLASALQILLTHEIGHAIGLGHPNQGVFYDTNTDPYDEMVIDPLDPFADLIVASIPADTPGRLLPIMWGGLSSADPAYLFGLIERLSDPSLAFDDRGGRDVLYPVAPIAPCTGDCDADGIVTIDELIRAVGIAVNGSSSGECARVDPDGDGVVRINELVQAVAMALLGCAG